MKIIITNGPPFCGKDTIVNELLKIIPGSVRYMFKDTLYTEVCKRYNVTLEEALPLFMADKSVKDSGHPMFNGKSPRGVLIYESEDVIKPMYGPTGVAIITANNIKERYPDWRNMTFIFPDGGFNNEIKCLMEEFEIERSDIYILRIRRDGCSYLNDSREFIKSPNAVVKNNGSVKSLIKRTLKGLQPWISNQKLLEKVS